MAADSCTATANSIGAGLTQEELAERSGLSVRAVSDGLMLAIRIAASRLAVRPERTVAVLA